MSSIFGEHLKLSVFGQSHGPAIGMTLDAVPAGLPVDLDALQLFLNRRAPGQHSWTTPRREEDRPEFLAGIVDGYTCGAPVTAVIRNHNTRSADYRELKDCPRPGHADYTAQIKYGGFQDAAGGGHFSGRLTAPLCIAGGLCKQWLEAQDIHISAHISGIGGISDTMFDAVSPDLDSVHKPFPVICAPSGDAMIALIAETASRGDSVGGRIECAVTGIPAGLGEPMFGSVESRLSSMLYSIPAVKAVAFGEGFRTGEMFGSQCNDPFMLSDGTVKTVTNHCGGILGGITNGMPLLFEVTFKPTPSVSIPQQSVSLSTMEQKTLSTKGRHDPCIVPRAVPVVEAAAAIVVFDMILGNTRFYGRK